MPRNGSGVYSHPFPDVVEGTTIESAVFNGNTSDVEQDLNTPRPIVAGGTGANNAHDAMIALSGEIAKQGPVDNFDMFPFVNGSWYCNSSATAAPTTSVFTGIYYEHANPAFAIVEARDYVTGAHYIRKKVSGVWETTWALQPGSTADLDAAYVNVAGDTMTGALTAPRINAGASAIPNVWPLTVKTGPNANFGIFDSGAGTAIGPINDIGTAFQPWQLWGEVKITSATASSSPATGALTVAGGVGIGGTLCVDSIVSGYITSAITPTTGFFSFGSSATKYLQYDGANFNLNGGALSVNNGRIATPVDFWCNNPSGGVVRLSSGGAAYLAYDAAGGAFSFVGDTAAPTGHLAISGSLRAVGTLGIIYNIDAIYNSVSVANNGVVCILQNFSGLVVMSNWTQGYTELFLCGAGAVTRIGGSNGALSSGYGVYAPAQNGYAFYNTSGATATVGLACIRTRNSA